MLVWWDGLTMIEKRVPTNKEILVRSTESTILAQATTLGTGGGAGDPDTTESADDSNAKTGSDEKGNDAKKNK